MASRKPSDHGTGIPLHEVEALARVLLPEIQKFFESEEGQGVSGVEEAAKQRIKSAAGHLKWMPRRFAPHRILLIEMINPNPSPTWRTAFGLSWIGRSIIIGLQESQSYQRFASRQQEVFPIFQVQICKGRGQKD